jgi:hypothetical protein
LSTPFDPPVLAAASAAITLPNVVKLLLINAPSFNLFPVAPVAFALSDPARSTSEIRDTFSPARFVVGSSRRCVRRRVKTACERDEVSFMFVAATVRAYHPIISSYSQPMGWRFTLVPSFISASTSMKLCTASLERDST